MLMLVDYESMHKESQSTAIKISETENNQMLSDVEQHIDSRITQLVSKAQNILHNSA